MYSCPLQCHYVWIGDLRSVAVEQLDLRPPLRSLLIRPAHFRVRLSDMELLVCNVCWAGPRDRGLLWTNCNALQRFQHKPILDVSPRL